MLVALLLLLVFTLRTTVVSIFSNQVHRRCHSLQQQISTQHWIDVVDVGQRGSQTSWIHQQRNAMGGYARPVLLQRPCRG